MELKQTQVGLIPENWDVKKISEATIIVTDYVANGSFASLAENVKYLDTENYAVLIRLLDYNNQFSGNFVFIDENSYNFLSKSKLFGGEIIISNVGINVGTVFKCPKLKYKMSLAPNSIMVKFRGNNDFYFHWLRSFKGQSMLKSIVTGSAQPKFNKTNFRDIYVPVPPLDIQNKIAALLNVIDDKIELNNKINSNLEQQAQALFKSWFVDFEPFGGTMPDDWKVGNLLDIADYLNGLAMQKFRPAENEKGLPVLKIKELRQGFCDSSSELCSLNVKNEYIVNDGDVIFSWLGSLLVDFWCCGKCGLNQHLFKVTSKNFDKWFYYLWTKHYLEHFAFIAADKATTMGHIKREELEKAKVIIPSSECYQKMKQIMIPIYDLLISNRVENNRLIQLRDTLLPKLMSGEIDVSKVDILNSNLLFRENA